MAENQNTSEQLPKNAKLFSILAYVSPLWLLGLLIAPEKTSPFVRNHVNNGIVLTIVGAILCCIPFLGWAADIVVCVFAILGIVAAAKNNYYTIPLIGEKFKILK